jgi:site-specific recombinase
LHLVRLFCDVATKSPTLVAARFADLPRFIDEISGALGQRIGADPIDSRVRLATFVIAGLVEVRVQLAFHHVKQATSMAELYENVHRDFLKAAQLAEPSLTAFDNMRDTAPV